MKRPLGDRPGFWSGWWRLADPKISLASISSMLLGASAAASRGAVAWDWLLVTVLGILAIEVAKNALGEVVDFESGTDLRVAASDRSPFSGGKRVLVDGLLTRAETVAIAIAGYAVGVACGLAITGLREPRVLWLGVVGSFLAYSYHGAPFRLSYRGFGELAVAIAYGPLVACGTYLVQRGEIRFAAVGPSLPLAAFITAFLWINEFPDYEADRASGKHNLVVRLGRDRARWGFAVLEIVGFLILAALPLFGITKLAWLGFAALPVAFKATRTILAHPCDTAHLVPAQAQALQVFVLYAIATSIGLLS